MADLYPDEGLDAMLAIIPKGGAMPAFVYIGLYTAQGGTSIPSNQATLNGAGANMQGCAEVSTVQWTTYTRSAIPSGSWGAAATSLSVWGTSGRIVTATAPFVFPAPTAGYNPTPNSIAGFFLSNASQANSGIAYYYSNFGDSSLIATLSIGDLVKVTPTFGIGNS